VDRVGGRERRASARCVHIHDGNSESIWDACTGFTNHLYWHKPRLVMLRRKIEALPDNHPSKPQCLFSLSRFGQQFLLCECHRVLSNVYHSEGDRGKAIEHLEVALAISSHSLDDQMFRIHATLVVLFTERGRLDDAGAHLNQARLHARSNPLNLAHMMELQAYVWYEQRRFEEAGFEALRAVHSFERLGAAVHVESCRKFLGTIWAKIEKSVPSDGERWAPGNAHVYRVY
jgi:tetratricopeptide (TPR) repeat protein